MLTALYLNPKVVAFEKDFERILEVFFLRVRVPGRKSSLMNSS